MVDTSVVLGLASGVNYSYGVASNGDGWRALWANDNEYSVLTTGIGGDGSLLDPQGIMAGHYKSMLSMQFSCIVGTGEGFMAVWPAGDYGIRGATLDSSGALLDSFVVFESDSGQASPAIAFDGDSTCLVVWTESPNGDCDILGARVTTSGQVLDTTPIPVADDSLLIEQMPAVAFGQGVYLVAWTSSDAAGAKAIRVSREGSVLDTAICLRHDPAMYQAYPAVAFGDTCFLAAWAEGTTQPDMYAARVSASGNLIDTAGVQLSSSPDYDMIASIGFDGTDYLVMWCDIETSFVSFSLCGRRVTADGVALDSGMIRPQVAGRICVYPSVAADQDNFLVAFTAEDSVSSSDCVGCVRVSPEGAVLDSGLLFPMAADAQTGPSGATDGTGFLAAWFDGSGISAARIAADGTVMDPAGFPIDTSPGSKSTISVAFGDSLYLVAWADYRNASSSNIYCARVGLDGHVLDPDGVAVCSDTAGRNSPDVSFDGHNFLVAWQDYRAGTGYSSIYAARVRTDGTVLDPNGFVVAAADTLDDVMPAACFTGTDHLVVWEGHNNNTGDIYIYGALVSPAGTITRPRFRLGLATGQYQREPSVARGSANSLVAWVDINSGAIYATRVRADGAVLDSSGLLVDSTNHTNGLPHVTANEVGFKVLWDNYDMDTTRFAVAQIDTAGDVVRSGLWFGMPGPDNGFDAVYGSGPELLLLFSCWTDTAMGRSYGTDRLWGRLGQVPGIEQADDRLLRSVTGEASVVRGVLFLPRSLDPSLHRSLLDISGRKVLDLKPGANDVRGLAPGVYFVRGTQAQAQAVRKVVVAR